MRKRKMVAIYLNDEEHSRLKKIADELGLSVSALVRLLVTNPDFAVAFAGKLTRDIRMELNRERTQSKEVIEHERAR